MLGIKDAMKSCSTLRIHQYQSAMLLQQIVLALVLTEGNSLSDMSITAATVVVHSYVIQFCMVVFATVVRVVNI